MIAPSAKWIQVGLGVQKPVVGREAVASGEVTGPRVPATRLAPSFTRAQ